MGASFSVMCIWGPKCLFCLDVFLDFNVNFYKINILCFQFTTPSILMDHVPEFLSSCLHFFPYWYLIVIHSWQCLQSLRSFSLTLISYVDDYQFILNLIYWIFKISNMLQVFCFYWCCWLSYARPELTSLLHSLFVCIFFESINCFIIRLLKKFWFF